MRRRSSRSFRKVVTRSPHWIARCAAIGATMAVAGLWVVAASAAAAVQTLQLTYDRPVVGARIHAAATGLTPGKTVELSWGTVTGGWVIEGYYYFRGKKYSPSNRPLGSAV